MDLAKHISTLLKQRANLKPKYLNAILSPSNFSIFQAAFTTAEMSPTDNYEWYEQVGDVVHSAFFIDYIYKRFPHLQNQQGVRIVARMRIEHSSRAALAKMALKMGFWPFINASVAARERDKDKLLEDVFEAFFGALKIVVDKIQWGFGFIVASYVLSSLYDEIYIESDYSKLMDAKSKLKEFMDRNKELRIEYRNVVCTNARDNPDCQHEAKIYIGDKLVASAKNRKLIYAEQIAAEIALKYINKTYKNL